jgi:hypothetical protein
MDAKGRIESGVCCQIDVKPAIISCSWRWSRNMKKRYVAFAVAAGLGLATIFLLFTLDLSFFWDRVCDAFT